MKYIYSILRIQQYFFKMMDLGMAEFWFSTIYSIVYRKLWPECIKHRCKYDKNLSNSQCNAEWKKNEVKISIDNSKTVSYVILS